MTGLAPRFRATDLFPPVAIDVEHRADGSVLLRSLTPRAEVPPTIPALLRHQAARLGDRTMIAARGADGEWQRIGYAEGYATATRIAGWLRDRPGTDRIMIVTGNSLAHALLCFGAAIAGVPVCPVSAQYAVGARSRLAHVASVVRPTLAFAERAVPIADALADTVPSAQVICTDGLPGSVAWQDVVDHEPLADVDAVIDAIDPDLPLRFMLTSGSTGLPKAVVQTNRMWCSLFAGANGVLARASGWGERTLDWMPWSHVAGLSVLIGSLFNGGSYYLDEGRPTPELFGATLRNLAEVQPLFFANVPYAFGMLCDALEADASLRERFFEHLQLCLYGGAGLPQPVYDRFQAMAEQTIGERVMFTTGYGCTEATSGVMSITWPTTQVGVGLPLPGLEVKLVPLDDGGAGERYEVRFRSDFVMPGYLDDPAATEAAFDEEHFYRTGDAVTWIDATRPELGLAFAGRLAEEFKLTTGTFVRGGAVRAQLVAATSPVVSDAVLCGEGYAEVGALLWLNPAGCAATLGESWTPAAASDWIAARLSGLGGASAEHVGRFALLTSPPDVAAGEMSDKGTVNQALARRHRAGDVANLYAGGPGVRVL